VSGPTGEADPAGISAFRLDKYPVTVGRFRRFVVTWNAGAGWFPPSGSGKHVHLNGGLGLTNSGTSGSYEPGWVATDDPNVTPTTANLTTACSDPTYATWTAAAGTQENLPINCVNWYEAYAFCIWDGATSR
jgi:formylglycine-generating enzyme required for sulfatase activity